MEVMIMATYNYNVSARYTLIGRIMKSTSVVAYVINDRVNGQIYPLDKGIVEQLALNKQIYNSYAQVYNRVVIMKGIGCKISELPKCNEKCEPLERVNSKNTDHNYEYKITGKIISGRKVLGYIIVRLKDNSAHRVDKTTVMQWAMSDKIINAKCQRNNGNMILRASNGYDLSNLPTVSIK